MILLQQKRYEEITVSEIANKAGVSRMTYYRTYSSKEDIVIQHFKEKLQEITEIDPAIGKKPRIEWYRVLLEFVYEDRILIEKILETPELSKASNSFLFETVQKLTRKYDHADVDDPKTLYELTYKTGSLTSLISRWGRNGCKESVDQILDWIRIYENDPCLTMHD